MITALSRNLTTKIIILYIIYFEIYCFVKINIKRNFPLGQQYYKINKLYILTHKCPLNKKGRIVNTNQIFIVLVHFIFYFLVLFCAYSMNLLYSMVLFNSAFCSNHKICEANNKHK